MSKAEKVSEPSMEEILASIRKIIAEEPSQAKPAGSETADPRRSGSAAPVTPAPGASKFAVPAAKPVATAAPAHAPAAVPRTMATPPPPVSAAPPPPAPIASHHGAIDAHVLESDLADLVDDEPAAAAPTRPVAEATPVVTPPPVSARPVPTSMPVQPPPAEKPAWRFVRATPRPEDAADKSAAGGAASSVPSPSAGAPAAQPVQIALTELTGHGAGIVSPAVSFTTNEPPAAPESSGTADHYAPEAPKGRDSGSVVPAGDPDRNQAAAADKPAAAVAPHDAVSKAAASALDALAAGLAAPPQSTSRLATSAPVAAAAASSAAPQVSAPVIAAPPKSAVVHEEPIARSEPRSSAAAETGAMAPLAQPLAAPAAAEATPAAALPVRTLEDTVAELLRPMLRQWLDANMPRIVEKALRVEMAAVAQPPKPGKPLKG